MTVTAPQSPVGPPKEPAPAPTTELPGHRSGGRSTRGESRRNLSTLRATDVYAMAGAAAASLAITWVMFDRLLPFNGVLGFLVIAYVLFMGLYALLVSFDEDGPAVRDRVAAAVVQSLGLVMLAVLGFVVVYTLYEGREALPHLNFYTESMADAGPVEPLSAGGILHAIVGTLWQISIALLVCIPTGLVCAVFLNEVPGAFSRFVRTIVEAMTALPSIVAGLFIYATFILTLGFDQSGLAAALAISVMMLPIIIRASDVVIRLVPGTLREASYALGTSRWRTVWHVVLPTSRSGLTTAVILGTARGVGETSPVLLTAGFTQEFNSDPFHDPMVSLPLAAFKLVENPEPTYVARGFGTAAVLLVLVLVLFVAARVVGGRGPGKLTRRQEHRRVRTSRRDAQRFAAKAASGRPTTGPASTSPASTRSTT
ncbi:phosphate ABC transporter permease PstA [Streptomyces lacrimifluminis]|uniref:Phosphate transport system permease protein PstA n=1 Tax=Streptomyces lacrimifluminis TaxID=1500077 RepID=A0A917P084_9ACTN|nr:phosphate ABC transporter permease PstA [Streptomyces lacrimifluminis]GGJ46648.1 phosphate transport system permease protein PstA [Streptomyces lacrimifluminis]